MKKKLLIDAYHLNGYRGISVYLKKLLQNIDFKEVSEHYDVYLLNCSGNEILNYPNLKIISLSPVNAILWEQIVVPYEAKKLGADLVFSPGNTFGLLLFFLKTKIVVTLHDVIFLESAYRPKGSIQKIGAYYRKLIWKVAKKKNEIDIITVSKHSQNKIQDLLNLKSSVIYHGIEREIQFEKEIEVPELKNKKFFLHIGGPSKSKRTEFVMTSFLEVIDESGIDASLVVIGLNSKEKMRKKYEASKKIIFLNNISKEYLSWCYLNCITVLVASEEEGFGFVPLEAASYGKYPIVIQEPISKEICTQVNIETVSLSQFKQTIKNVYFHPSKADYNDNVGKIYNWEFSAEKHKNLFINLYKKEL